MARHAVVTHEEWVSSLGSDFNRDYHVTFSPEDLAGGEVCYNYSWSALPMTEGLGISVFCKDDPGDPPPGFEPVPAAPATARAGPSRSRSTRPARG